MLLWRFKIPCVEKLLILSFGQSNGEAFLCWLMGHRYAASNPTERPSILLVSGSHGISGFPFAPVPDYADWKHLDCQWDKREIMTTPLTLRRTKEIIYKCSMSPLKKKDKNFIDVYRFDHLFTLVTMRWHIPVQQQIISTTKNTMNQNGQMQLPITTLEHNQQKYLSVNNMKVLRLWKTAAENWITKQLTDMVIKCNIERSI